MKRTLFLTLSLFASVYGETVSKESKNDAHQEITDHVYTLPGITGVKEDHWVGSDNLFNLSRGIGVVAEIVLPTGREIPVTPESLKIQVNSILSSVGIDGRPLSVGSEPPLPMFHILVMVLPLEKGGYVVSCSGRLFEQVQNPRVTLEKGIFWQAITWEKQDLLFSTADKLPDQIKVAVERISRSFAERYKFFQNLKANTPPSNGS